MIKNNNKINIKNERSKIKSLNVVLTGGSRGLGKAMKENFNKNNDKIFIISRNYIKDDNNKNIKGIAYDIGKNVDKIDKLYEIINNELNGEIHLWINNAAQSGGTKKFIDFNNNKVEDIIDTNLKGTILLTKYAITQMKEQKMGGSIFNFAGAGSDGFPTPHFSVYGSTKSAITQFSKTIQKELKNTNVNLYLVSPGMMTTELLLENIPDETFNFIKNMCSEPELVAHHLVPAIRRAFYNVSDDKQINYLTISKIIYKLLVSSTNIFDQY